MTNQSVILVITFFLIGACNSSKSELPENIIEQNNASTETLAKEQIHIQREQEVEIEINNSIEDVALSFHRWNIESILNESESIAFDFDIIESANGKCKLDSASYFNNLRELGTISEKFIELEWERVRKCSNFLGKLAWNDYKSADAYEYQDDCDIYSYYWTRTQEPFHGVEVRKLSKVDNHYLVTLVFYYEYEGKDYSEYFFPLVKVEKESGKWKITKINWLEK